MLRESAITISRHGFREGRFRRFLFFFSSRRRHTRFDCDWSSDVCSSDLFEAVDPGTGGVLSQSSVTATAGFTQGTAFTVPASGAVRLRFGGSGGPRARFRSEERRVGKEGRSRWSPYL